MVVKYVVGSREFSDKDEALKYEEKLEAEKKQKEKLEAERVKRRKEVENAYKKYNDLYEKYRDDYGYEDILSGWFNWIC